MRKQQTLLLSIESQDERSFFRSFNLKNSTIFYDFYAILRFFVKLLAHRPVVLQSDNGVEFTAKVMKELV